MHLNTQIVAAILAFTAIRVAAAPVPQLAGEGAACNSILSSTDNGVGYGTEDAEDGIAKLINPNSQPTSGSGSGGPPPGGHKRRQLAGEGAACDSILSSTDNGVGYGVEDAEDGIAKLINPNSQPTSGNGSGGQPAPAPAPGPGKGPGKGPKSRRQLDKIAAGLQNIAAAAGYGSQSSATTSELESIDGTLTGDAANAGASLGDTEVSTLEGIGKSVPKRQLDKIAAGLQNIAAAAGYGSQSSATTSELESIDGTLTGDAANAGASLGDTEVSTLEGIGKSVP